MFGDQKERYSLDEDFYARHQAAVKNAAVASLADVKAMELPTNVALRGELFNLGEKINEKYIKAYTDLLQRFPDQIGKLAAVALRCYWIACWEGANYLRCGIELKVIGNNDHAKERCTAKGYAKAEGGAWTLYGKGSLASDSNLVQYSRDVGLTVEFNAHDLLLCMALYWLQDADIAHGTGATDFDLIHEAYDAFDLVHSEKMWDEAFESGKAEPADKDAAGSAARSAMARAGALARRDGDPRNLAKSFVKTCWDDWQLAPSRYAGKAAFARDMLDKQTALKSQKVIEDWCRLWDKQSAS